MKYPARLVVSCLLILQVCIFVIGTATGAQTTRIGNVVDNFLIPIPLPSGICYDGESFWIPNYSAVTGNQQIYKLDMSSHKLIDSIRALDQWPTGLAWDGKAIWVRAAYPTRYNTSIVQVSTSDSVLKYIPAVYSCYWAGIAWDGRNMYYGTNVCFASPAGQKSMIYKVDPTDGAVIDSFPPPSGNINGLVYDKGHLWYIDDNASYIFKIDTTGRILYEFPLPKDQVSYHGPLTGLTVAKHHLWVVDMAGNWGPRIYEIDIGETPAVPELIQCDDGPDIPGKIKLGWLPSSSANVEWYRIYRDGPVLQGWGDLATAAVIDSVPSTTTTYVDSALRNGYLYAYWVSAVDSSGVESHVSNSYNNTAFPLFKLQLGQNYPNPFNATTTIPYEVITSYSPVVHVTIRIYDILGRKVATLVDKNETMGDKTVLFNASNLPSGVYFYRMQAGSFTQTRKLVLIK